MVKCNSSLLHCSAPAPMCRRVNFLLTQRIKPSGIYRNQIVLAMNHHNQRNYQFSAKTSVYNVWHSAIHWKIMNEEFPVAMDSEQIILGNQIHSVHKAFTFVVPQTSGHSRTREKSRKTTKVNCVHTKESISINSINEIIPSRPWWLKRVNEKIFHCLMIGTRKCTHEHKGELHKMLSHFAVR